MHIRFLEYFVYSSLIIFAVTGCSGGYSTKVQPLTDLTTHKKTEKMNEAILLGSVNQQETINEDYLIGSEDVLEIEAYNVEELKKTVRVNSEGEIGLPLVGIIHVKGLTTSETEKLIAKKLEKYVEETLVTVFVKEYKSQRISVIGAVNKSQVFAVTGQRNLLDMLMMAEGLAQDAGTICYIIRPLLKNNPANRSETIVVDLNELLLNGNLSLNIPVFAGDVINVPKGGIFFVDGSVKMPGVYTMKGKTSLSQAISMAQGIKDDANFSDIRIFRENGKGEREVFVADYDAIRKGNQSDIIIAENDIIIVPQSGMKNFFNKFISTIKGFITFGAYTL